MKTRFCLLFVLLLLTGNAFGHGGGEAALEVGPEKGVLEVTSDKSFKLSPEAMKTFEIITAPVSGDRMNVLKTAVVHSLKKSQIFRLREGYLKAIDFKVFSKTDKDWVIQSAELRSKDEIVTAGVGFLRIIVAQLGEITAEDDNSAPEETEVHHD